MGGCMGSYYIIACSAWPPNHGRGIKAAQIHESILINLSVCNYNEELPVSNYWSAKCLP